MPCPPSSTPMSAIPNGGEPIGSGEKILAQGMLSKRAYVVILGWNDRFFVLLPTRILYFSTSNTSGSPRGHTMIASIRHIEGHAEKFGRRFVLELVSVHGGMWALQCKDAKEMALWKDQITQAYAAIQARSAVQPSIAPGQAAAATPARSSSVAGASFHERYRFGRILDKGSHGKVYEAMHVQSGTPVAIKEVSAKASSVESEDQIEVWAQVRHENIIRLLDFHRTDDNLYFVMEMANGRDLFYGVVQHYAGNDPRGYSESDTVKIMSQILSAIRFLHLRKIVHCDLKPDNVLVTVEDGQVTIKLADWGYAQIISDEQGYLTSRLGTVNYMAPEIMARQAYNQSADIWSCGIILYVLLCGFPPYEGVQGANGRPDYPKTLAKIQQRCDADGRFDYFPDPYWSSISKSSQDLIRSMVLLPTYALSFFLSFPPLTCCCRSSLTFISHNLPSYFVELQVVLDPAKRLSADACLKHPWLSTLERRPSTDRPPTSPTFFVEALERIRGINADR